VTWEGILDGKLRSTADLARAEDSWQQSEKLMAHQLESILAMKRRM
jgi:hypothetical protein